MKINGIDIEAVIFDLDGTLYIPKWLKLKSVLHCFPHIWTLKTIQDVRKKMRGIDYGSKEELHRNLFQKVSSQNGKTTRKVSEIYIDRFCKGQITLLKGYKPRAGLSTILEKLKSSNVKLVLLSDYPYVKERIESLGIDSNLFQLITDSESYGALKPSARVILDIADKLNIPSEKILIVGDRDDTDGEASRQAKTHFIHIINKGQATNDNQFSWEGFSKFIMKGG